MTARVRRPGARPFCLAGVSLSGGRSGFNWLSHQQVSGGGVCREAALKRHAPGIVLSSAAKREAQACQM